MLHNYDDVLTIDELTELLKIGRNTAYNLVNSGQIKSIKLGRIHRIPRENVVDYIMRRTR